MTLATAYGEAFLIGLSVAAPIGPVNVEIIRRGLTIGPGSAFFLGCGAVSADCVYCGISLMAAGLASSILQSQWGVPIGLGIGGAMLFWLGAGSIRPGRKPDGNQLRGARETKQGSGAESPTPPSSDRQKGSLPRVLRIYGLGLAMTLANPMTIALWLSIAASFTAAQTDTPAALRLAGVASGAFAWVVFIVAVVARARPWVNPLFLRVVNLVSGSILIGFALRFWINAFAALSAQTVIN